MKIAFICLRVAHDGVRSAQELAEHAAQRLYTLDHVSDAAVLSAAEIQKQRAVESNKAFERLASQLVTPSSARL